MNAQTRTRVVTGARSLFDMIQRRMSHPAKTEAAGIEPPPSNTGETQTRGQRGAESGASHAGIAAVDADLAIVIAAWPDLSKAIRHRIVELARQVIAADQGGLGGTE